MKNNNNLLTQKNATRNRMFLFASIAVVALFVVMMFSGTIGTAFAGGTATTADTGALDSVMNTVVGIVTTAAFYIGIVITLWGVFQIILALRREDSEGISKQITTVVVGAVLVGFGAFADDIISALQN